jgi:preprotein translocase subunit SecG
MGNIRRPMTSIFIGLLTVILVAVCLLLVLLVLMQRPKQEGLGAALGGDTMQSALGAQTTNVLQKGTVYLAIVFFITTSALSMLVSHKQNSGGSAVKNVQADPAAAPVLPPVAPPGLTPAPGAPTVLPGSTPKPAVAGGGDEAAKPGAPAEKEAPKADGGGGAEGDKATSPKKPKKEVGEENAKDAAAGGEGNE